MIGAYTKHLDYRLKFINKSFENSFKKLNLKVTSKLCPFYKNRPSTG